MARRHARCVGDNGRTVILQRMILDGEQLSDLMAQLDLGWKARTQAKLALMADLHPHLTKRAGGRDFSGLSAYEL